MTDTHNDTHNPQPAPPSAPLTRTDLLARLLIAESNIVMARAQWLLKDADKLHQALALARQALQVPRIEFWPDGGEYALAVDPGQTDTATEAANASPKEDS